MPSGWVASQKPFSHWAVFFSDWSEIVQGQGAGWATTPAIAAVSRANKETNAMQSSEGKTMINRADAGIRWPLARTRQPLDRMLRLMLSIVLGVCGLTVLLIGVRSSSAAAATRYGEGTGYCAQAYPGSGHILGPEIDDVYACGPVPLYGNDSGPAIPVFWPTTDLGGFQCTELAIRYLYDFSGTYINIDNDSATGWGGQGKSFASDIGRYLHVAVVTHTDGASSPLPQVGDILSESVAGDETTTEAGTNARDYGDVGIVKSVSGSSIQLMVENNDKSGLNSITIHSATDWSINGSASGYYYKDFSWFAPPPPIPPVSMPASPYRYVIYNTGSSGEYSSPTTVSGEQHVLPAGNIVYLTCQQAGSSVGGSALWDYLTNGGWVPDAYVDTQNFDTFSYPIPPCINPASWNFEVSGVSSVIERSGPSSADGSVGSLAEYDTVSIVCQTSGGTVGGSRVWDYQANHSYVPDWDVSTPVTNGGFDTSLPRCPNVQEFIPKVT